MPKPAQFLPLALAGLALLAACDNVGRAFDPGYGGGTGSGKANEIFAAVQGGTSIDGRPRVRAAYPKSLGWPNTVPAVVVFSESMNQNLLVPAQGRPLISCRLKGTTTAITTTYHFLQGGSVVLMRPVPTWPAGQGQAPEIEVVVSDDARDADGVRIASSGEEKVVATFTPDLDGTQDPNGRIVVTLPEDNAKDQQRETALHLVFDRPVTTNTVTTTNFKVDDDTSTAIAGAVSFPIVDAGVADGRVARFVPTARLPAGKQVRITVDDTIKFPNDGKLDFLGKPPFSRVTVQEAGSPDAIAIGNPTTGFPDKINRSNLTTAQYEVTLPTDSRAGDEIVARLYALDPSTQPEDDLAFVEARASVTTDGQTSVIVPLTDLLGTLDKPRFGDGAATFAARVRRGSRTTGWIVSATASDPRIDIQAPTLSRLGPPSQGTSDLITDQELMVFHGVANETISRVTVEALSTSVANFGSATGGRFMARPIDLAKMTGPIGYSLSMVDAAGNTSAQVTGNIVPRGVVTGVQAGALTVEVYDEATLQVVPGAIVLLEPGMPQKPAVGRTMSTTGTDGRVTFNGLAQPKYTVTVLAPGYHLTTFLDTAAAHVSLPLRPTTTATASVRGNALFTPGTGVSARVGCNVLDDPLVESVRPTGNTLPELVVRPSRLIALSGFAGAFDATGNGAFTVGGCTMCGTTGTTATPAAAALAPAGTTTQQIVMQTPALGTAVATARYNRDFAQSTGLGALDGTPTVRVMMSLRGLAGNVLVGVGTPRVAGAATSFDVDATFSLPQVLALAPFLPVVWISMEGRDAAGNIARHRGIVLDVNSGATLASWPTPGIPTITAPGGASAGSPSVTFADRLDRTVVPGGLAFLQVTATDAAGRQWSVWREDDGGAVGATAWQFPDLAGVGVAGLGLGTWKVRGEAHLIFSITQVPGSFLWEELRRAQVTYARSASVDFIVN